MPQYRFTVITNDGTLEASETLYTPSGSADAAAMSIQAYIKARNAILYPTMSIQAVRVSIYGTKRSSVLVVPPGRPLPNGSKTISIPPQGQVDTGGIGGLADSIWRTALQYTLTYNDTYVTQRYLAGIPGAVIGTQRSTYNPGGYSGWTTALMKFLNLVGGGGYYIQALQRTGANAPQQIQSVVQQQAAPGYIGIQVASFTGAAFAQGARVIIQGMRPPKGQRLPTINGQWTIDSVVVTTNPNVTTIYLRGSSTIDPAQQRITPYSTVSLWGKQLYVIQNALAVAVVPHARGKQVLPARGRRLSRPSLDP
ncbi:MAG TPA: hypothetical protein VGS80_25440 [Ktedonobacterales bacterium]|nr:hypothetical protein [Ktedonobacterales bacterium]